MIFTDDTDLALGAAVEVANSALEPEGLTDPAALTVIFERYRYSGRHDGDEAELAGIHAIRPRLRELLLSDRDRAVELVNAILAEHASVPRLVRHDTHDWHIHAVDQDIELSQRMLVETAMAMIDVIRADETSRLSVCADESCEGIVLDLSRNRSKRYCSTACTNRNAVAAYRARRAQG